MNVHILNSPLAIIRNSLFGVCPVEGGSSSFLRIRVPRLNFLMEARSEDRSSAQSPGQEDGASSDLERALLSLAVVVPRLISGARS